MLVAIDPAEHLPDSARKYIGSVPSIHLSDNPKAEGNDRATVLFLTATYGIRAAGTVYRMDDVSLPLRPVLATKRPTDEEVLVAIERRVHALQVESGMKPSSSSKRAR
jgi:formylmethanofuran dehydrogenase subunit B